MDRPSVLEEVIFCRAHVWKERWDLARFKPG